MPYSESQLIAAIKRVVTDGDLLGAAKAFPWGSDDAIDACSPSVGHSVTDQGLLAKWAALARKEIGASRWANAAALLEVGHLICNAMQDKRFQGEPFQRIFAVAKEALDCGQGEVQSAAACMLSPDLEMEPLFAATALRTCGKGLVKVMIKGASAESQRAAGSTLFELCEHPTARHEVDNKAIIDNLKRTENLYVRGIMVAILLKTSWVDAAKREGRREGFLELLDCSPAAGPEVSRKWADFWGDGEPSLQRIPNFVADLSRAWQQDIALMGYNSVTVDGKHTLGAQDCLLPLVWVHTQKQTLHLPEELVSAINQCLQGAKVQPVVSIEDIARFQCSNRKHTTSFALRVGGAKIPLDFDWTHMHSASFGKRLPALLKGTGKNFRTSGGLSGGADDISDDDDGVPAAPALRLTTESSQGTTPALARGVRSFPAPAAAAGSASPASEGVDDGEEEEITGKVSGLLKEWLQMQGRSHAAKEQRLQKYTQNVRECCKELKNTTTTISEDCTRKQDEVLKGAQKWAAEMKSLRKKGEKAAQRAQEHQAAAAKCLATGAAEWQGLLDLKDQMLKEFAAESNQKVQSGRAGAEKKLSDLQKKIMKESKAHHSIRERFGSVLPTLMGAGEGEEEDDVDMA